MSAIKQYRHLLYTNAFGVAKKIKDFQNENKNRKQNNSMHKKKRS